MKYLLPFVALFLLAACQNVKNDEPLPSHSKLVQIPLIDSLGIITIAVLKNVKKEAQMMGTTNKLLFDTIQKIDGRYYAITVFDYSDSLQRKEVTAATIINENPLELTYELLSAKKDSITDYFIPEALSLLKTIRIHGGGTKTPSR